MHERHAHESHVVATAAVYVLLFALMLNEYAAYFNRWAVNPNVADAFSADYLALGYMLDAMPREQMKYVLVNANGVFVASPGGSPGGVPMPAQTVMYITDTWTAEKQHAKNIYYINEQQYQKKLYPKNAIIIPLNR